MESSSGGKKKIARQGIELYERLSRFVQEDDSDVVPVIDLVEGSKNTPSEVHVSNDVEVNPDELDDLVEEQLVLSRIQEMQNARLCLNKEPVRKKLSNDNQSRLTDIEIISNSSVQDCDEDSLLNSFMGTHNDRLDQQKYKEDIESISKALTLNLLMQSELTNLDLFLTAKLKENQRKQAQVKEEINFRLRTQDQPIGSWKFSSRGWYAKFGMPYFKDNKKFHCSYNSDFDKMMMRGQILTINLMPSKMWRVREKLLLEAGIKKSLIEENSAHLSKQEANLKSDLSSESVTVQRKKEIRQELQKITNELNSIKQKSLANLFSKCCPDKEFDWLRIATEYVKGRSAKECRSMWHLYVKPSVNKRLWHAAEDNKLLEILKTTNDWDEISKRLGTSRTGYQCFVNYQTRLNKCLKRTGKWTREEDIKLSELVMKCKIGDYIPWGKIAYYFEGRSLPQIYCRWNSSLNPDLKKGRFSKSEDKQIVSFVRHFGEDFPKMSKLFKGRTSVQLRERYLRAVPAKYQNTGRWSLEEDELLLQLVKKHGVKRWSEIAEQFLTRTRTQIRQRFSAIQSFLQRHPKCSISDVPRGLKAQSQRCRSLTNAQLEAVKEKGDKLLEDLIRENNTKDTVFKYQNKMLVNRIKKIQRGRKKITARNDVDVELINYFKESYTNVKLRIKTDFMKPDVDKAANAMSLFCSFLKTHLVLSGERFDQNFKQMPPTLRKVITKMLESDVKCNRGCNCLKEKSFGSNHGEVKISAAENIDCLPVNPRDTMINENYYLLSEITELPPLDLDEKVVPIPKNELLKHFIQYYLPPNIMTSIGFRSVLLIKDKINACLVNNRNKVISEYFSDENGDCRVMGLKKFTGYFSDDCESDDESHCKSSDKEQSVDECYKIIKLSCHHNDKTSLPSVSFVNCQSSIPSSEKANCSFPSTSAAITDDPIFCEPKFLKPSSSSVNTRDHIISLPSTSHSQNDTVFTLPFMHPNKSNYSNASSVLKKIKKDQFPQFSAEKEQRLTKDEAINLWKERIMALFGWPIVLSQQTPNFSTKTDSYKSKKSNTTSLNAKADVFGNPVLNEMNTKLKKSSTVAGNGKDLENENYNNCELGTTNNVSQQLSRGPGKKNQSSCHRGLNNDSEMISDEEKQLNSNNSIKQRQTALVHNKTISSEEYFSKKNCKSNTVQNQPNSLESMDDNLKSVSNCHELRNSEGQDNSKNKSNNCSTNNVRRSARTKRKKTNKDWI